MESKQADRTNSLDLTAGLRSREHASIGATLGAAEADSFEGTAAHWL